MTGWVGYVNSQPVTTAVTCVDGEAIGVYSVATVREHRGRGYGETITRFAIDAALYRRMGYRPVGRFAVYVAEAL
jgi:ribosomal protein S18 acetylase RimI-like enzyme